MLCACAFAAANARACSLQRSEVIFPSQYRTSKQSPSDKIKNPYGLYAVENEFAGNVDKPKVSAAMLATGHAWAQQLHSDFLANCPAFVE